MNYGLYLSAGGVLSNLFRQDALSSILEDSTSWMICCLSHRGPATTHRK